MRLLFMGTPAFALPSLEALLQSKHEIVGVCSQPDKPAGRGLSVTIPPVALKARDAGLPLFQPPSLKKAENRAFVGELEPDAIAVVAYGKLIPSALLNAAPHGCINLHPSLLPKYRGASPIQSALANGEEETGVTTMLLDEGMDTGPLFLQQSMRISEEATHETLSEKLARVGAHLLLETLDGVEAGTIKPRPQDDSRSTFCRTLKKEDGLVRWEEKARTIYNRFRAYIPWPGTYTFLRGKLFKIHWLVPLPGEGGGEKPGTIIAVSREGIRVAVGDGSVVITHVQIEGKRRIHAHEFILGHRVAFGERFTDHP